jgi:putative ABC transport system permease protein
VELYVPAAQAPGRRTTLVIRTEGDPNALVPLVRRELAALDRTVPVAFTQTMEERMRDALAMPKLFASLFSLTRELGVRLALGARTADVRRLVVAQGMLPVALGVAVGLAGALAAARALRGLLFGVGETDPLTFGAMTAFLVGIALLAAYLPARRATRVAPTEALRAE